MAARIAAEIILDFQEKRPSRLSLPKESKGLHDVSRKKAGKK